jgi:ring-1,2-phenylacetyl-CoA epoxidase subunit PaaC
LILSQRLGEWCGHAPVLEEDLALANMALDLLGQARGLLTLAGQMEGQGRDEDQLAFLRLEREYLNPVLVELPNAMASPSDGSGGRDFALATLRNAMVSGWLTLLYARLEIDSSSPELRAIAAKAVKEVRYHWQHAADWVVRLGDGTDESKARMQSALKLLWPYASELFAADVKGGELGPDWASLRETWSLQMSALLEEATLVAPPESAYLPDGRHGIHSEHMGHLLAPMQHLQRAYPGGVW